MTKDIFKKIPENIVSFLKKEGLKELRPSQEKSIKSGLFENNNNQIIATPTGSGKTLVAELAMLDTILNKKKRVIYVVPLKALASEKYKEFKQKYSEHLSVGVSIGEIQDEKYKYNYDLLLVTSEKLDSLIRHNTKILDGIGLIIIDEIHLLNDEKRGPTLEILLSIFKTKYPKIRLVGLSATIGNSKELSEWLCADLIEDNWRPVELQHCVLLDDNLLRYK